MSRKDLILVVDLDGTLSYANTYKLSFKWLLLVKLKRIFTEFSDFWTLLLLAMSRNLGTIDRVSAKRRFQYILASELAHAGQLDSLLQYIEQFIDDTVASCVKLAQRRDWQTILATAALPEYAIPLARKFDFDHVVCSSGVSEEHWQEALGERKAQLVKRYCGSATVVMRVLLLSDHADDLPLASYAEHTLWVNPICRQLQALDSEVFFDADRFVRIIDRMEA